MAQVKDKIDLDRGIEYSIPPERRPPGGVSIRQDPQTGADVFMYKNDPGTYYSGHGEVVAVSMAKRAGFDVERHAAEKEKRQKMVEFEARWRDQQRGTDAKIVEVRGNYQLEERPGLGYYVRHIESGDIVTRGARAMTEQQGKDWLSDFAGPPSEKPFDGTPESVKVADDDIQQSGKPGLRRVNRRSRQDAEQAGDVRQPVNS